MVVVKHYPLYQLEIKIIFLHSNLEDVDMEQSLGIVT
jgi:hypothetical protein